MPKPFAILDGFLEHCTGEVEGRGMEEITPEIRGKLRALARGELPEPEQDALAGLLKENRHWVELLAREIKALRESTTDESRSSS